MRFNTSFYFPRYTLNFMLIICTIHKIVNFLFSFCSLSPSIVFNFSLSFEIFVLAFFSSSVCFNFFFTVLLVFLEVHNSAVPEVSWIVSKQDSVSSASFSTSISVSSSSLPGEKRTSSIYSSDICLNSSKASLRKRSWISISFEFSNFFWGISREIWLPFSPQCWIMIRHWIWHNWLCSKSIDFLYLFGIMMQVWVFEIQNCVTSWTMHIWIITVPV